MTWSIFNLLTCFCWLRRWLTLGIVGIQESWKKTIENQNTVWYRKNYVSSRITELYTGLLLAGRPALQNSSQRSFTKKIRLRILAFLQEKSVNNWLFFLIHLFGEGSLTCVLLSKRFIFFFSKAHSSPESFIDLSLCRSRKKQWN